MYYYTYLIIATNKKSSLFGKVYFGQHQTENLDDNYTGSGKLICKYIKKHPNDYYKEIIKFYDSQEELNKAEYELIHPHLGKDYCLNLVEGGSFGKLHPDICKEISKKVSVIMKKRWQNLEYREKQSNKHKELWKDTEYREKESIRRKELWKKPEFREKMSNKIREYLSHPEVKKFYSEIMSGSNNPMYGKNYRDYMTDEAKEIQGKKQRKQITNRRFLNNGINCVLVKPEFIDYYISQGYKYGKLQKKRRKKIKILNFNQHE